MPAQRVCAPALVATPVRDRDPPVGRALKRPPPTLASPWARKSREVSERDPSGLGTAALMPAAWASATRATATAPVTRWGAAARSGSTGMGRLRGMAAMSETCSTSSRRATTATVTIASAIRVASPSSRRTSLIRAQATTVAVATSVLVRSQLAMWTSQSMILPIVLALCGS